ncbi:MAG TPA: discoidin domain-containing protein [Planctomycetota bacterium]
MTTTLLLALLQVNLAQGKPATASSEEAGKGNLAAKAVDGSPDTRWCASAGTFPQWWQVDLGAAKKVKTVRISWESDVRHEIEGSTDGKAWTKFAAGADVRHLRVTCLGSKGGWASFFEFEAYEGDAPAAKLPDPLKGVKAPPEFDVTLFGEPPVVNYPVCLAATPDGTLFVGVDENGSLGKVEGYGKVLRCVDADGDGKAEDVKVFARMRHPRGLVWDDGTLWVLHPPFLTRYRDTNGDGVADEEQVLLKGISPEKIVAGRGADHTTNAIRMGIDGWIYIAVGDYGYHTCVDVDGKSHQLLGGGIARVRPDGRELEVYARGTRNICDVAIDPFLNCFTRDNTNDGGGWDIRVSYLPQSAHMGYPSLYKNFADELFEPLAIYGGGSGTGALHVDEPWLRGLLTADWGRGQMYLHPLAAKGAGFTVEQKDFLRLDRVTSMDVDGAGRLYAASWRGGEFSYKGPNVGFVVRLTPKGWKAAPFPDLKDLKKGDLLKHLASDSAVLRFRAQREILRRGSADGLETLDGPLAAKVAAIFTLKQLGKSTPALLRLAEKPELREFALRALADRDLADVPSAPFVAALADPNPRVRAAAAVGLGRLNKPDPALVKAADDPDPAVAHVAYRALAATKAAKLCLASESSGAYRALRWMHTAEAVDGLIAKRGKAALTALVRLYHKEGEWPDKDWWGTRPDSSGPYYRRAKWEESPKIEAALRAALSTPDGPHVLAQLARHKVILAGVATGAAAEISAAPEVDLKRVLEAQAKGAKGGVGGMAFEEAQAAVLKEPGDAALGAKLFQRQGCASCHTISPAEAPRGPMLLDIAKRYEKPVLIQSILKPNAVIAQGFESFIFGMSNGDRVVGFVTDEGAEDLTIRTAGGERQTLVKSRIEQRKKADLSMMPEGLVAALTPKELASLLAFLETLTSK